MNTYFNQRYFFGLMAARISAGLDMPIFMTMLITITARIRLIIYITISTAFKLSPSLYGVMPFVNPLGILEKNK